MAFGHGKSCDVYVNGRDLSSYFTTAGAKIAADAVETTTFGKNSKTFIAGLKDSTFSASGLFDAASTAAVDAVFNSALGNSTESLVAIYPHGDAALGDAGYAMRGRCTSQSVDSDVASVVATAAEWQGTDDVDRVVSHHVLGAETSATSGASIDNSAQTTAGAAAHLHVTAFTGTSITVKIQDSADNSSWADVTGLTFTAASAAGTSERVATATTATIRRYTRATWTGTFTTATFHVAFSRK